MELSIGEIAGYYGGLLVKEEGGKYYWGIDDLDPTEWEEIPKSLYDELIKFEEGRNEPDSL